MHVFYDLVCAKKKQLTVSNLDRFQHIKADMIDVL